MQAQLIEKSTSSLRTVKNLTMLAGCHHRSKKVSF